MPYVPEYDDEDQKLKAYRSRVEYAEQQLGKWHSDANIFLSYYRLTNRVFTKGGQKVRVPAPVKNVDAMFAVLTAFEVVPVVVPKGFTQGDIAMVADAALKNEWDECRVVEESEDAIKESLITKIGFAKVSYRYEESDEYETEVSSPQMDPDTGATQTPTETVADVIEDRIVVEHIPWDEVYFDPEAKKWKDCRWVYQVHDLPLDEAKQRWPGADLKATTRLEFDPKKPRLSEGTIDEERVRVFEMYDLPAGTKCWFDATQILEEGPNPFGQRLDLHQRNPYVAFITRSDPGNVPGISDIEAMKTAIDEANTTRSNLTTFVDRVKPKLIAAEGAFTDQGKNAFKSQEFNEVVELRQGVPMSDVMPMPMPSFSNELLQGLLPAGRKTATAMQHMAQASTVRQAEKRNRLERFYKEIADRILYLMKVVYDQPRIARIVENYGDVVWDFDSEDISFEYALSVELEPKEIKDTETMREMGATAYNLLREDPLINGEAFLQDILVKYFKFPVEDVRNWMKTAEQQQEEAMAAAQEEAAMTQAAEGQVPDPNMIPGPVPGDALMRAVNATSE
jgi:hypothetical protein